MNWSNGVVEQWKRIVASQRVEAKQKWKMQNEKCKVQIANAK
jgi:hypothetical protein